MLAKLCAKRHTIRSQIFFSSLLLILLPALTIALAVHIAYYRMIQESVQKNELITLNQISYNLQSSLSQIHLAASSLTVNADILSAMREYRYMSTEDEKQRELTATQVIRSQMYGNGAIKSITFQNLEGRMFSVENSIYSQYEWDFVERLLADGAAQTPSRWRAAADFGDILSNSLIYQIPVADYYKGNTPMGQMVIIADAGMFSDVFDVIPRQENVDYFLLSSMGNLIYGTTDIYSRDDLKLFKTKNEEDIYQICEIGSQTCVVTRADIASTDWQVVCVVPKQSYLVGFSMFRQTVLITMLLTLGIALWFNLRLSAKLTLPVQHLVKSMRRVQTGNFSPEPGGDGAIYHDDEIGYLKRCFDDMIGRIDQLIQNVHMQEQAKRDAELNALQAQINPHFLYNTLNSISCLARINGQDRIGEALVDLSDLLRRSISNPREFISLAEETDLLKKYCALCNLRWGDHYRFSLDLPKELEDCLIPKFTLQPLVENSFTHGFAELNEEQIGDIQVTIRKEADKLMIYIMDNGLGLSQKRITHLNQALKQADIFEQPTGKIGIANINGRLRLHFGSRYGLQLKSNPAGGLICVLCLPIHHQGGAAIDSGYTG